MSRLDAIHPDDSTPESRAWEMWADKVNEGDTVEVVEGGYAGHRGLVEAFDDYTVHVRITGNSAALSFRWEVLGPVRSVRGAE